MFKYIYTSTSSRAHQKFDTPQKVVLSADIVERRVVTCGTLVMVCYLLRRCSIELSLSFPGSNYEFRSDIWSQERTTRSVLSVRAPKIVLAGHVGSGSFRHYLKKSAMHSLGKAE